MPFDTRTSAYRDIKPVVDQHGLVGAIAQLRQLAQDLPVKPVDKSAQLAKEKLADDLLAASYSAIALEQIQSHPGNIVLGKLS